MFTNKSCLSGTLKSVLLDCVVTENKLQKNVSNDFSENQFKSLHITIINTKYLCMWTETAGAREKKGSY